MNTVILIIAISLFILLLGFAIYRARKANTKQSASDQHPAMFKKPDIERVEKYDEE